jgi:hypothetical protein
MWSYAGSERNTRAGFAPRSSLAFRTVSASRVNCVFAIRLARCIIGVGAERLSYLLQCGLQCVTERRPFRVGCRLARIQVVFFVSFRRHARGERFLIVAAVPVCVLKANGAILFFLRRHPSVRRLLRCSAAAKHDRTCYHENSRALRKSPKPVHVCPPFTPLRQTPETRSDQS